MVSTAAATKACLSPEFCVVGSRWESLKGAWVILEAVTGATAAGLVPGERQGGRERPPLGAASLGLASRPQWPERTSEGGRATQLLLLSRDPHARAGEGFGPVPWESPRKEPQGSPPFPDVS